MEKVREVLADVEQKTKEVMEFKEKAGHEFERFNNLFKTSTF